MISREDPAETVKRIARGARVQARELEKFLAWLDDVEYEQLGTDRERLRIVSALSFLETTILRGSV